MMNFVLMNKGLKKRKGSLLAEIGIYMVIVMVLLMIGYSGFNSIKDTANRTTATNELNTLKTGVQSYVGLSKTSSLPTDLGGLITGLTAAQSIDKAPHVNFVSKDGEWTSTASTFVDPWGVAYDYDAATRTITSTAGGGTAIVVNF